MSESKPTWWDNVTGPKVAADFNAQHPVGTPVKAWPGDRSAEPLVTTTRTPAWVLGHGTPVVSVKGYAGGIALSHIEVIPSWEAARAQIADPEETAVMDAVQPDEPEEVTVPGKVTYEARGTDGGLWQVLRLRDTEAPVWITTYDSQTAADAVALFLNAWAHREVS